MKTIITAAVALAVMAIGATAWAASPGEAGFKFLDIGTDARAEGLGGAYTAAATGVSATYYNPSGMVWSPHGELLATYHNWVDGIQSGFVGGTTRLGEDGRVGLSIQYLDYGNIDAADASGESLGDFGASDLAVGISFARMIGSSSSVGVTGRFITESIDDKSATGLAFDAGLIHKMPDGRTRIGAAVRNAGFQMTTFADGAKDDLPITFVAGLEHDLRDMPFLVTADVFKPNDDDFGGALGLEFLAADAFRLRAGYNSLAGQFDSGSGSDDFAGFRFGAGFVLNTITIDYGYGSMSKLGTSHRFTLRTNVL
ncbi:MAG: PorV/PorQ family protein [candidate division Zixibacteria bacterium]|nr:PorV/PorQ family protein [candidate division Zixibacteria bacterium]